MKNLLFTVLTFGLISSSAFAEEKTPERLQEEKANIQSQQGLEKWTFARVIGSGKKVQIGFFTSLNPDCTSKGDTDIRITKQPEHGTIDIAPTISFPSYPKEHVRYKCNQHKVKGVQVNYKSAEKYVGDDALDLLALFPTGFAWEVHYDVSVR
jgi:hypothetical protein